VASPISNDKILPSGNTLTSVSNHKGAGQERVEPQETFASGQDAGESAVTEGTSVDVDRASQVFSQSQSQATSGENSISTPEQARMAVTELREQIAENSAQALQAQTGGPATANLSALLEAAPA
jgi:hypothetical protein